VVGEAALVGVAGAHVDRVAGEDRRRVVDGLAGPACGLMVSAVGTRSMRAASTTTFSPSSKALAKW
jgi:hypothetical protein